MAAPRWACPQGTIMAAGTGRQEINQENLRCLLPGQQIGAPAHISYPPQYRVKTVPFVTASSVDPFYRPIMKLCQFADAEVEGTRILFPRFAKWRHLSHHDISHRSFTATSEN